MTQHRPKPQRAKKRRKPVTRESALTTAIQLADKGGLEAVTMRRLAQALKVEPMSLYHHVANKEAILDGMVDLVFTEIALPDLTVDWKTAIRKRIYAVRETLLRHRWALQILESRKTPGVANLAHHDAMLGCFRKAGFSVVLAGHAYALLDSFIFGFVHTELSLPFQNEAETQEVAGNIFASIPAGAFPHLVELTTERVLQPGYTFASELSFGLELILDGLERALTGLR